MRNALIQLDGFNGGGYKNTFKQMLDVGSTYEEICLNLENINIDQVERVEVILNGDPIVSVDGQHLKDLDTHTKMPAETGVLRIPFRDLSLQTDAGQSLSSLVTMGTDNLILAVKIAPATQAQIDAGAVPGISGYSELSAPRGERVVVQRIYQENIAIGATGENNYKTFMTGPGLRRMFFRSADMESLRIKIGRKEVFELSKTDQNRKLERYKLAGVTNQYIFAPIMTHWGILDMLDTEGRKLEIMPTVTAPGDIPVVFHTLENAKDPKTSPLRALQTSKQ
ncbi:major capsid protein P2 [Hydrogenovibrio sp. 3SP14C1]|uniref:major capsid protein P2 n=1 Tax=Hydrogenovibrio sp. 3SP14C1 TaxID=3038774 RepID=UPI0024172EC5|nr:major capsid protein P2 [Hydrogenovibrio sp. 3SP14C1]MDG4812752.1 major capsid protein P2 [Hydrogenovibrio sp. 3SP14C1]